MIDGGPAFPIADWKIDLKTGAFTHAGMSLRDYFAARLAHGQISSGHPDVSYEEIARNAYGIADAMLKVREVK